MTAPRALQSEGPGDEIVSSGPSGAERAVVLVWAPWAAPSRPAPTVLRELARRWGPTVTTLVLEDPAPEVLDLLGVELMPTWLALVPADAPGEGTGRKAAEEIAPASGDEAPDETTKEADGQAPPAMPESTIRDLSGTGVDGETAGLPGIWRIVRRRAGALPKHLVDEEFGPSAIRGQRAD